ncbi:tRNA (N6-threonylcarbamoyladenosine(37)-N6)-methyltransferase TrmO [Lutibacter sp. B1]|uniref:tRNA (N6-threonylcarbamoyladenosine(37)-N6)-methyltransferase TrmO n=1 Tax=Lutibacter sp. B1 TaxID=2725996 RepID=UPI0014570335|nr:tRNA (N6-threonylcarbamoyladenosine(37)-N6)-methyltransferase TrmO [Lutibacter sp. B1]NLP58857.1 tRNA (N6-threonylcarbamoyladenosine(37)-N6)-methyltransferase TrmO [Lutibacter sp. B1]
MSIKFKSIGTIYTPFKLKEEMPIQSKGAAGIKGTIKLKKKFTKGLKDLNGFSHIYLIYHLHKSINYSLLVTPFLDSEQHGVFATRAPKRPNPIGISVVKILTIKENMIEVEGVDMLDKTPLLDIKPFVPQFDNFETDKIGWLTGKTINLTKIKSDKRFQ